MGDDDADPTRSASAGAPGPGARRRAQCFALHGNRDFLLGAVRRSAAAAPADQRSGQWPRSTARPVLLTHGDALCTDDHSYQESAQRGARPGLAEQRFLALPRARRELLARMRRAPAAAATPRNSALHHGRECRRGEPLPSAPRACGRMIHGHTHRPGVHRHEVDGAWTPSALVLRRLVRAGS